MRNILDSAVVTIDHVIYIGLAIIYIGLLGYFL